MKVYSGDNIIVLDDAYILLNVLECKQVNDDRYTNILFVYIIEASSTIILSPLYLSYHRSHVLRIT